MVTCKAIPMRAAPHDTTHQHSWTISRRPLLGSRMWLCEQPLLSLLHHQMIIRIQSTTSKRMLVGSRSTNRGHLSNGHHPAHLCLLEGSTVTWRLLLGIIEQLHRLLRAEGHPASR